jgi:Rrf2 family protein
MKIFSKAVEHALRALMYVIEDDPHGRFSVAEVCDKAGVPLAYARKAFQAMARAGLLDSIPGPGGGYGFALPLKDISLLQVVEAVDGPEELSECPLGLRCDGGAPGASRRRCQGCQLTAPNCGLAHVCPLHDLYRDVRSLVYPTLEGTNLADIARRVSEAGTA